ncbi:two-component system, OmpR family, response regulator [Rubritalea squalenifaciens DSM 18772]|uniref:Two-component system, OmpR family, response regulator n=1 Tax=Rubritalea squalenifaciens DSM 18772 TaxID=1123071 RepID=A0A1M6GYH3_9BACT|nr:response regulator transcription factor [Rubritalea squalenifaciens]SHJ14991.1 two-component system, OmpR family, response regulator [Rubritalea squalenifaciens DSM 18772]
MLLEKTMKVLVIEDDADVRQSLVQTLEEELFVVDAAVDGAEGLYRASEWQYDVIVLDVMLPELDGWKVIERLRVKGILTPVLMLTALGEINHRIRGLDSGADDFLSKPFDERELVARLYALHRRATGRAAHCIELGQIVVNTVDQTVSLRGEQISLTASQYRIVAHLATRAGQVISREELAEAIISEDNDRLSNVIDVQIHHIRRKLGKDFIVSRRGLGYVIPVE